MVDLPGIALDAQPGEGEVGEADVVAHGVEEDVADHFGRVGGQPRDGATALADHELARPAGGLIQPGAVAEVEVADEAEALEDLEVAVGGGDIALAREALGAQRAV
jgi:hypothetical protein